MTKNEDVSWIPKTGRILLKGFSTAELIAELKTRSHDEICPVINEMGEPACVFTIPTKSLVAELTKRDGVCHAMISNDDYYAIIASNNQGNIKIGGNNRGPIKILWWCENE